MTERPSPFALHLAEHSEIVEFLESELVDELAIHQVGKDLLDLIRHRHDAYVLVLDFHRVEHLSSTMLGLIITLHNVAIRGGGEIVIAGLSDSMLEAFRVMRLHRVLRVCDTAREALRRSA